ncbi:hypothetical protein BDM02DRAFT_3272967 [Thelephora ganbajun]|uniref:Uncharacterized protein n=1 Tax=Thelephora ganbajun TaxID=370292 RepID=A0ACB6Z2G4_THEGA|nr:hypothetical protein BDM02DRAFT_3272967 [Thelephora ganbajun]
MPPTKTPTSSLSGNYITYFSSPRLTMITATAIELLIKRIRYRIPAGIRKMLSGGVSPETPTTRSSSFTMVPQEVIEMIITHLAYDTRSLLACSLTCYFWYIIAVRHLHHTLITEYLRPPIDPRLLWPKPLREANKLGLLPLVKKFQFHVELPRYYRPSKLSTKQLNWNSG